MTKFLFNEFDSVSKDKWLAKIKNDLKGRALQDFNVEIGDLKIDPFIHLEDLIQENHPILTELEKPKRKLSIQIPVLDENQANELLDWLAHGINVPKLSFPNGIRNIDLDILFDSVHFDLIHPIFAIDDQSTLIELSSFLKVSQSFGKCKNYGIQLPNHPELLAYWKRSYLSGGDLCVRSKSSDDSMNTHQLLASKIYKLHKIIQDYHPILNQHEAYIINIPIGIKVLVEIAKCRALRILWHNYFHAIKSKNIPKLEILGTLKPGNKYKSEEDEIIALTLGATGAFAGGVDIIDLNSAVEHRNLNNYFSKTRANIFHILQLECNMDEISDPAAGSYTLETLTNQLAEKAWNEFLILIEKNSD